jgi:ubiquinone/menaquinone biosynthesis C-methylase UbiE
MKNWKIIWENKHIGSSNNLMQELLTVDGFDTGCGSITYDMWDKYIDEMLELVSIKSTDNVLEVGCGAGAFLYPIKNKISCEVYGYDFSNSLINIAQKILPKNNFKVSDALVNPFNQKFDYVFSHSVFQYFESEEYAYDVIETMQKSLLSGGKLLLLGVLDKNHKASYIKNRIKYFNNEEDYNKKYSGLDHMCYEKEDVIKVCKKLNLKNIMVFDTINKPYESLNYAFNIIATNE